MVKAVLARPFYDGTQLLSPGIEIETGLEASRLPPGARLVNDDGTLGDPISGPNQDPVTDLTKPVKVEPVALSELTRATKPAI